MFSKLLFTSAASVNEKLICTLMILTAIIFVFTSIFYIIKIINVQKKLRNSDITINLYASRWGYIILSVLIIVASVFFVYKAIDSSELLLLVLYICSVVMCLSVLCMFLVRITANAGIAKHGIYLFSKFILWENLHDFYINEKKFKVVLSTNWKGPLSLIGTTVPLKFDSNKLELIKTTLSENRNKFFTNLEIR